MLRSAPRLSPLLVAIAALSCSEQPACVGLASTRSGVELDQEGKVFALATTLLGQRSASAREREAASRATGALLAEFVNSEGNPLLASNGTRIRGSCGVTFIAPSYAVTAAHCVDSTVLDTETLVVEMYRPTAILQESYLRATALSGSFPDFEHPRLGASDGYLVDRFSCAIVSRCSELYGGPVGCEESASSDADTALVRCDGAPGYKYGFLSIAAEDDLAAEVFMPWQHEVYATPQDPADDRWQHYVEYSGDYAQNYHYFGADDSGVEQNQLLPLISVDLVAGVPHQKVSAGPAGVHTDLLGCHGSSGAGALQQESLGLWQLLGPMGGGSSEHEAYLCNHIPALDGSPREPGFLGIGYMSLGMTQYVVDHNRSLLEADCELLSRGTSSLYTHLSCPVRGLAGIGDNADFVDRLAAPTEAPALTYLSEPVATLAAGEQVSLSGFELEADVPYRLGFSAWTSTGCTATPCPQLSAEYQGREVLTHVFDAAPAAPVPVAATLTSDTTGSVTLSFSASSAERFEIDGITIRPEARVNSFDTMPERLEAVLFDLESPTAPPQPMRFVGDGASGFAAWLLENERMVLTRQAIAAARSWTATFTASAPAELRCGLLDEAGQVVLETDCSAGLAQLDDSTAGSAARAGFFIETSAQSPATAIDNLRLVSDAMPDSDGDSIPDVVDACPNGPLPVDEPLAVSLPETSTHQVCLPAPATLTLPVPELLNACEAAVLVGRISMVNGRAVEPLEVPVSSQDGQVLVPLGSHAVVWQAEDQAGHVHWSATHAFDVVHAVGPQCCAAAQSLVSGTTAADTLLAPDPSGVCALGDSGDDLIVSAAGGDWLWGGGGGDYLTGGQGHNVLVGGSGADYLSGGGELSAYAGDGNDTVHARGALSAVIFGGRGADVLVGSDGPDEIYPGPGTALVAAGDGDDTVTLYDPCELSDRLRLVGGAGQDTLFSSVPRDALLARGVQLEGFENVVVDASRAYLAECFGGDE